MGFSSFSHYFFFLSGVVMLAFVKCKRAIIKTEWKSKEWRRKEEKQDEIDWYRSSNTENVIFSWISFSEFDINKQLTHTHTYIGIQARPSKEILNKLSSIVDGSQHKEPVFFLYWYINYIWILKISTLKFSSFLSLSLTLSILQSIIDSLSRCVKWYFWSKNL